jgi:hypothetical protein
MRKTCITLIALFLQAAFAGLNGYAQVANARYPAMAPLGEYLMPESAEIALPAALLRHPSRATPR